ncbi:hypothetical protein CBOM_07626 [Ceraceosorus bombacis]|uniref:Uncharacterized protein n=1 Tax=Ceraceosorus bombacis TaxID=401625 RepID=A0A0P1BKG0_9BASI|nr:hypothetical protein CBOM_07626 [Ceraceosorus bombacis]
MRSHLGDGFYVRLIQSVPSKAQQIALLAGYCVEMVDDGMKADGDRGTSCACMTAPWHTYSTEKRH